MFDQGSHYYTRAGEPFYEIQCAGDPTKTRNVTIADARKLLLVPSSTTIQKIKREPPALSSWIRSRLLSAAWDNRFSNLEFKQWKGMVVEAASSATSDAADAGSQYHLVVESIINNLPLPDYELDIPVEFFTSFSDWWINSGLTVVATELSFANSIGYGGRIDLWAIDNDKRDVIVDWKTRNTEPGKKVEYYKSQPVQLVSYAEGIRSRLSGQPRLLSVIISRNEPGRIESYYWPDEDYTKHFDEFKRELGSWIYDNDYDPSWREDV